MSAHCCQEIRNRFSSRKAHAIGIGQQISGKKRSVVVARDADRQSPHPTKGKAELAMKLTRSSVEGERLQRVGRGRRGHYLAYLRPSIVGREPPLLQLIKVGVP